MRGIAFRSVLVVSLLGAVAGCDELVPLEPEQPKVAVAKPAKKAVAPAPVVKKKPVIVFDDNDGGGGGWN